MSIFYILVAILLLGILVAVHEFGHYIAARIAGIEVMEFSLGFGPKLLSRRSRSGPMISLRAIPMGGFCAFYGEDDADGRHVDDPRAYSRQNVWKRIFSVLMGPVMNFILAFIVAVGFYWIGGVETVTGAAPYIAEVAGAGPAYEAGLKDNDVVTRVNGIDCMDGTTETLLNAISAWREGDEPLHLTVRRGEELFETDLTPFWDAELDRYRIGVTIGAAYETEMHKVGFGEAAKEAWDWCVYAGGVILTSLRDLVTTGAGLDQTSGPVGVVSMVSQEVQAYGLRAFLNLLIVISINLGIMNLLPIPGLDGSRFLFMLAEVVRGKPIPPQKEAIVHLSGYVLLFGLMILITFRDILNLFK